MINEAQLLSLLQSTESFRIEKTTSTDATEKFREAICAFANDMPGSGLPGFLLIGYDDKAKKASGLKVSDDLLEQLASYARDGTILPPPALVTYKITLSSGAGEIAVVEVQPSEMPPVRYQQRICVRTGPRRGYANQSEERIPNERRLAAAKPFDTQPCVGSSLDDLATDLFLSTYRPEAVAPEVIAETIARWSIKWPRYGCLISRVSAQPTPGFSSLPRILCASCLTPTSNLCSSPGRAWQMSQ